MQRTFFQKRTRYRWDPNSFDRFIKIKELAGNDDPHYTWFYDTLYPDLLHDADDMRYINFRYTDAKVTPEPITGYYPHDHMHYSPFLNKKEDNTFRNMATIDK